MEHDTKRLPAHVARELAVQAETDPRTILSVHRDPSRADANAPCSRAARVLRDRGYLPNTSSKVA